MRVIHLCFQLHEPLRLKKAEPGQDYFESKAEFAQANQDFYQPFFAFLERTTQKYREFKFSLLVSGSWLELAERYDAELIERLRKLVKLGQVELVAEPLGHSLAFFYDRDELAEQTELYRAKIQKLFGVEGRIFALPDFLYCDQIGKWAEDFGFAGMLAGGSPRVLDWHSPNHVYEAMECRYLRLLFQNTALAQAVTTVDPELLVEKRVSEESEETKPALSAQKFQKRLELDMLRGNLVNLYFDAKIFGELREKGVIGFFDELVGSWLAVRGNHFVGAAQACVVETPSLALVVKETVSWREESANGPVEPVEATGVLLKSEAEVQPPRYLSSACQIEQSKALYSFKREILASEDERIIEDWRRLTAVDYLYDLTRASQDNFQAILADLKARAAKVKKAQAVEISRAYTKKHDRGDVDAIKVNFGPKPTPKPAPKVVQPVEPVLVAPEPEAATDTAEEARVEVQIKPKQSAPKRGIRKVIHRLVIE